MNALLPKSVVASLALLTLSALPAHAAIIVTLPTATSDGSLTITQDIYFNINPAGGASPLIGSGIALQNWVTNDGTSNAITGAPGMSYTLNGTLFTPGSGFGLNDNLPAFRDVSADDGMLTFYANTPALVAGDSFILKAGTFALPKAEFSPNFNLQANQTFTGNAFLVNGNKDRLSDIVSVGAVPEPSRALLAGLGVCGLLLRRRRGRQSLIYSRNHRFSLSVSLALAGI